MDSVKLSVAVCHTPGIASERDDLVKRLRRQYPELTIVHDYDREGCWPTSLKATRAIYPRATHHMVVHDHAYIPNPDALMRVIEAKPESWISPYCPRKEMRTTKGLWAKIQGTWGTASIAPVQLWDEYRQWVTTWTMQAKTDHDDRRVVAWMKATGRGAWIPIPNVVTHTGVKSLLGHSRARGRGSQQLITADSLGDEYKHDDGANAPWLSTTPTADIIKNVDPDKIKAWHRAVLEHSEITV